MAAWKLYEEFGNKCSQLDFTLQVVQGIVSNLPADIDISSQPGPSGRKKRYFRSPVHHFAEPAGKQGRCCLCKKNTTMKYKACTYFCIWRALTIIIILEYSIAYNISYSVTFNNKLLCWKLFQKWNISLCCTWKSERVDILYNSYWS